MNEIVHEENLVKTSSNTGHPLKIKSRKRKRNRKSKKYPYQDVYRDQQSDIKAKNLAKN